MLRFIVMNTVQFTVEACQLLVDTDDSILFAFMAFLPVGKVGAVLVLIVFFRPVELFSIDWRRSEKVELHPVWAYHIFHVVDIKIIGTAGVVPVPVFLTFLLIHGKFHVLPHAVHLAVQIVVQTSIPCVGNRILGIYSVSFMAPISSWKHSISEAYANTP